MKRNPLAIARRRQAPFAEIGVIKVPEHNVSLLTTMFGLAKVAVTAMPATVMRAFNVDVVVKLPLVDPVIERELGFVVRSGSQSIAGRRGADEVGQAGRAEHRRLWLADWSTYSL
jgi:hypothetical protein